MAIFKPPTAPHHTSEVPLFEALHALDDDWRIYGSVIWQSLRKGRQGDGEIDFVLCHPLHGLIVVELKGGTIRIQDGRWCREIRGKFEQITNPFEQITANKHALISFLKERGLGSVPVNHAVCFPHCSHVGPIGAYGHPDIVWWASDMHDIRPAITRTIHHWKARCRLVSSDIPRLDALLAPTVQFCLRLADTIGGVNKSLLNLTEEQLRTFRAIQRNRRAIIRGGPGTGKTLMSIARARRLKQEGFRPLWTCYNELLAKVVSAELKPDGIDALTFHALCIREARSAKLPLPAKLDAAFWIDRAPELLVEAAAINDLNYDAIIVDEGQDFAQGWIDALEAIAAESIEPPIYIFADAQQRLYDRTWNLPNCSQLDLERNCRNTKQIATRVYRVFGSAEPCGGADGPEPIYSELADVRRVLDRIEDRVTDLILNGHLRPDQITVLLDDDGVARQLRERYAASYPFVQHGQYGVAVETIARFKGLENDVIIVALCKKGPIEEELRHAAYVGFSRAKAMLMVIADPKLKPILNW